MPGVLNADTTSLDIHVHASTCIYMQSTFFMHRQTTPEQTCHPILARKHRISTNPRTERYYIAYPNPELPRAPPSDSLTTEHSSPEGYQVKPRKWRGSQAAKSPPSLADTLCSPNTGSWRALPATKLRSRGSIPNWGSSACLSLSSTAYGGIWGLLDLGGKLMSDVMLHRSSHHGSVQRSGWVGTLW